MVNHKLLFFKGRTFHIRCNGACGADTYTVLSCVPQGSVLGPLLFIIFVNDMFSHMCEQLKWLFADDTKVGMTLACPQDCDTLQHIIDIILNCSRQNGMMLNASKSSVMSFTRKATWLYTDYTLNGATVPRNKLQRDLGVLFDSKMTFRSHVEKAVRDCNRFLEVFYRLLYSFDTWEP